MENFKNNNEPSLVITTRAKTKLTIACDGERKCGE